MRPASWGAREGLPERKVDQKWERNSVVVACVRERRSKIAGGRSNVFVPAVVVENVGEEVVRVSRVAALVRMVSVGRKKGVGVSSPINRSLD